MKRLHIHVSVDDIADSVRFYQTLFAAEPSVLKGDYAKWMLEDPRVNFAISKRGSAAGVRHLGIQVENKEELEDVYARLVRAKAPLFGGGRNHLLLRREREELDRRSAGRAVGDVSHDR